jgi:uncharacterized protein YegJ (DUF2314 family)
MANRFRFPWPGGDRAMTSGGVILMGVGHLVRGWALLGNGASVLIGLPWLVGGALVGLGVALWCRRTWARWPAVGLLGLLAGVQVWGWIARGYTFNRVAVLVGLLCLVWFVYQEFSPKSLRAAEGEGETEGRPLISLVLLLRKPRHLEAGMLARYCEAAWGGKFETLREGEDSGQMNQPVETRGGWVGGRSPFLLVGAAEGMFLVHNHDHTYFEDPQAVADQAGDLRLRQMLEDNRGWLAVDLMSANDRQLDPASFYPQLARLIAELAGPDCQAIFQPDEQRFNHWDESLEARLRAGDLAAVFAQPTRLPVVEVNEHDPRMAAATAEAVRRWPEFVAAFESGDAEAYSVKVPLSANGNTEFIWVAVERMVDGRIHGKLGNDPVDLGGLREGAPVEVAVSEVQDWGFVRGGEVQGMFTTRVLLDLRKERRESAG